MNSIECPTCGYYLERVDSNIWRCILCGLYYIVRRGKAIPHPFLAYEDTIIGEKVDIPRTPADKEEHDYMEDLLLSMGVRLPTSKVREFVAWLRKQLGINSYQYATYNERLRKEILNGFLANYPF